MRIEFAVTEGSLQFQPVLAETFLHYSVLATRKKSFSVA
jgi:hypothetical protein